jgi:drug/metabolite transporter (DMT)-like permease
VTTLVAALVLLTALTHAGWNALLKGKRGEPLSSMAGLAIVWALVGAPLVFVVPAPSAASYPHLVGSTFIHLVYLALLVAAYERGDLSVVYPIARGLPPVIVAVAAWFLVDEALGRLALGGLVLVTAGVLFLGWDSVTGKIGTRHRVSVGLAFATACCIASYTVIDGMGVRASDAPAGYVVWLFVAEGATFAIYAIARGGRPLLAEVSARKTVALVAGVLSAGAYAVVLWAMTRAPIALVAALRETSVIFAAVIGTAMLGEPFGRKRVIAAASVAAGIVAIKLGA